MKDEDILIKLIILTNPLTYIGFIFIGIFWLLKYIYKNCQFHNLWFYHFRLKSLNESELKKIDNWCKLKLSKKINKWERYVITLNQKRVSELLKVFNR